MSHLKHETFSSLQYATDFGTIFIRNPSRELRNRPSSYYPVQLTGMSFRNVHFMNPLSSATLPKQEEETMKNWLENYRPVR